MKSKYPSPCIGCDRLTCAEGLTGTHVRCDRYHTWLNWWFKEIKRLFRSTAATSAQSKNKFTYFHPDEYERYLQHSPCEQCKAESFCDRPCPARLRWWEAWMERIRKRMGM